MFEVIDYSAWKLYDGFSEGSGRSEKQWLQSSEGTIGLFKFPKMDPESNEITYEHISEHLAHQLGNILGVDTARVALGKYNNRLGSMSYLVNEPNEELREGASFILGRHPLYDPNTMRDEETGEYYAVKHLFEVSEDETIRSFWIKMMIFDFLIGNRDRHQNNWAFLMPIEDREKSVIRIRPCPLYDNGSSLCCYITDKQVDGLLGKDKMRFHSLVDTKSRSIIRINSLKKKQPMHSEVVRFLMENYQVAKEIADDFLDRLSNEEIITLINRYPEDLMASNRKQLVVTFLAGKMDILAKIRLETKNV